MPQQPVMPVQPQELPQTTHTRNTNRFTTRALVTCALMCAISVLLSFVEFPLLPGVTWLKFDASATPALLCGFAYGPLAGTLVGIATAIVHGILFADLSGAVMNILVVAAFVAPASIIFRKRRTLAGEVVGCIVGSIIMVIAAIAGNLVITPAWLGVPVDAVIAMILPILLPFNALKAVLNSILSIVLFRLVKRFMVSDDAMSEDRSTTCPAEQKR